MGLFSILMWMLYGMVVGSLSKAIHPGADPEGFFTTMAIGISGSFLGGGVNFVMGWGNSPLQSSGIIMGILGGVITCALYRWYKSQSGV